MVCYTKQIMVITKYPHSCFHVSGNGSSVLIDIGCFTTPLYPVDDMPPFNAILITHQHADHLDPELHSWLQGLDVQIYANQDVATKFPDLPISVIHDGSSFRVGELSITALSLEHCKMPDGSAGPPNTGYLINDTFFHPGDGIELPGKQIDTLALPIAGPSISLFTAVQFARQVQAKKVIPMHYDNPIFFNDPGVLKERFSEAEVIVLKNGESTEV